MSRVALIGENSVEYIETLIDIWNKGDCAVLLDWRIPCQVSVEMMLEAGVRLCYVQEKYYETFIGLNSNISFVSFKTNPIIAALLPSYIYDKYINRYCSDEAVVIYSSGTTGKARGIILSHYAINTNADAIIDYMRPTTEDCIYIAKTLSYSSTLTGELLVALKAKAKLVIAPTIVPPRYVLNNINKFGVTVACLNPTLLLMLADEYERTQYGISSLAAIYVSGSILSDKIYREAHTAFYDIPIYNAYGLSEAAPRVTAQTFGCCKGNSVGKPIKDVEIAIVDENGKLVPNGVRGIIQVKTPSMFSGYVTGNEKHASPCQGWLNTGDIGFWDEFDELHIVGRVDDVLICDAHKIYPTDVEKLILENPSISDCTVSRCTVNGTEMIGCLYVSNRDCVTEIVHGIKDRLAQYEIPKKYLRTEVIPHNHRGKVDRKAVVDILSD